MKLKPIALILGATIIIPSSLVTTALANIDTQADAIADESIIPAARPTPPAMRSLDPSAAREREEATATPRHPRDIPVVRADPEDFIQNARDLMDQYVVTERGEYLGPVEDLVIDINTGQILFIAVGPEPRLRPVPPQVFSPQPDENLLMLDTDLEGWERAPSVERGEIARLARDRDAHRIYRHYELDFRAVTAEWDPREPTDRVFGAPARWHNRHRTEPQPSRVTPDILPPDHPGIHSDMRWEREFGVPHERVPMEPAPAAEQPVPQRDEPRFGARSPQWETTGPTLRNPRLHNSHRGRETTPYRPDLMQPEFGAPDRAERMQVPHAERLMWIGQLLERPAFDRMGEPVGELSNFIIDLNRGWVQHVVVTYEDPVRESFAIPPQDLNIDQRGEVFVRPDVEFMQNAPVYEKREARLQPFRAFRLDETTAREFGAPEHIRQQEDNL